MLRVASTTAGFACGMEPTKSPLLSFPTALRSSHHELDKFVQFDMKEYSSQNGKYNKVKPGEAPFVSPYRNLGDWALSLGITFEKDLVSVCYGGTFAVSSKQMQNVKADVWEKISTSLMRGDNIQKGHFAERDCAGLLSQPLKD